MISFWSFSQVLSPENDLIYSIIFILSSLLPLYCTFSDPNMKLVSSRASIKSFIRFTTAWACKGTTQTLPSKWLACPKCGKMDFLHTHHRQTAFSHGGDNQPPTGSLLQQITKLIKTTQSRALSELLSQLRWTKNSRCGGRKSGADLHKDLTPFVCTDEICSWFFLFFTVLLRNWSVIVCVIAPPVPRRPSSRRANCAGQLGDSGALG